MEEKISLKCLLDELITESEQKILQSKYRIKCVYDGNGGGFNLSSDDLAQIAHMESLIKYTTEIIKSAQAELKKIDKE